MSNMEQVNPFDFRVLVFWILVLVSILCECIQINVDSWKFPRGVPAVSLASIPEVVCHCLLPMVESM